VTSRILLVALLLVAPATLPAVAHASPPDPTWIHGIYDGADLDDVVTLATSGSGDVPVVSTDLPAIRPPAGTLPQNPAPARPVPWASAARPRAPPPAG
jgi:hypothetical protein